jgi:hypothetical protein
MYTGGIVSVLAKAIRILSLTGDRLGSLQHAALVSIPFDENKLRALPSA